MVTLEQLMEVCNLFRDESGELYVPKAEIIQKMRANYNCTESDCDRIIVKAIRLKKIVYFMEYKEPYLCDPVE